MGRYITCKLVNHNFVNEVQTITQVFFPDAKLIFVENASTSEVVSNQDAHHLEIVTEVLPTIVIAKIFEGERTLHLASEYTLSVQSLPLHLSPRRVLMLALYHALQKVKPTNTPWGALTGIRPSKMVREWLNEDWPLDKIRNVLTDTFCCQQSKALLAMSVANNENIVIDNIYEKYGPKPMGIYIGIPFCPTRCIYCSFNVDHVYKDKHIYENYVDAVIDEMQAKATRLKYLGGRVSSIYIGGGTPTVLSEELLEKLLKAVSAHFECQNVEYTVEAGRPDTITHSKLTLLRKYGVNRIAINPQTLNNRTLKLIGRNHTVQDFYTAFKLARKVGFDCISTDVIVGLPGEKVANVVRTMDALLELSPENITVHTLAVKRASHLNAQRGKFPLPTAEETERMLLEVSVRCLRAGFDSYYMYRQKNMVGMLENIGYSLDGHECHYNIGMMTETQTILGIGAGAVSKFVEGDRIWREINPKNAEVYLSRR